jgi:hypothetical protein
MAIVFSGKQHLGKQVLKFLVEGEPISSSGKMPIRDVFEIYQKIGGSHQPLDDFSESSTNVAVVQSDETKPRQS